VVIIVQNGSPNSNYQLKEYDTHAASTGQRLLSQTRKPFQKVLSPSTLTSGATVQTDEAGVSPSFTMLEEKNLTKDEKLENLLLKVRTPSKVELSSRSTDLVH